MSIKRRMSRRGATLVLVALLLPVVIVLSAMAVNVAYMELTRTELQVAADAAARAGGRILATTGDPAAARSAASNAAARNFVGGKPLTLRDSDIEFGTSTRPTSAARYAYTTGGGNVNSIRVLAGRTAGSADGPLELFFAPFLGRETFETHVTSTATQVEMDIALVIDRSGSMAYSVNETAAYPPNPMYAPPGWAFGDPVPPAARWLAAVQAAQAFLVQLQTTPQDERVALCTYSNGPAVDADLTTDYAQILAAMNVYTQSLPAGATNIGDGIFQARDILTSSAQSRAWSSKVIVVMTDGIHNIGNDPVWAAQTAAQSGMTVFSVTFADEAEQWRMQQVANAGAGRHYHANSEQALVAAFRDIARSLPTLLTD